MDENRIRGKSPTPIAGSLRRPTRMYIENTSGKLCHFIKVRGKHPTMCGWRISYTKPSREKVRRRLDYEPPHTLKFTKQVGSGASTGLWTNEIQTILGKVIDKSLEKDEIPIVARDEVPSLVNKIKEGDDAFGFIYNTANSNEMGEHWIACFLNNRDSLQSAEVFDSLGNPTDAMVKEALREMSQRMNPQKHFLFKENKVKLQPDNYRGFPTMTCGSHAIKFLKDRYNGIPFSKATHYSEQGESQIQGEVKRYDSFL
jgi:hypothetical protein